MNDIEIYIMNGEDLKRRRNALGLTQRELADKIGFEQSAIARWEAGKGITRGNQLIIEMELSKLEKIKK